MQEENKNKPPETNPLTTRPEINPPEPRPEIKAPLFSSNPISTPVPNIPKPVEIKPEVKTPDPVPSIFKPIETKTETKIPEIKPEIKKPEFNWEIKPEQKEEKKIPEMSSINIPKIPSIPPQEKQNKTNQTGGVEFLNDDENKKESIPVETGINKIVRTFESDISLMMKDKKGSAIKIAMAEGKKRAGESFGEAKLANKNVIFLFIAGIAIVGGLSALGFVYLRKESDSESIVKEVMINSIIPAEKHTEIPTAGMSQVGLIKAIMDEMSTYNIRLDTVLNLYFTETVSEKRQKITTEKFFEILGARIPSVLLRSLDENFMFGIHAFNGNQPFIILKTDFYENAFLGLLRWEGDMATDILPIFGTRITPENSYLIGKPFIDATFKNKDVRVLLDKDNKAILIYAIPNRQTIVITPNEDTLNEVTTRLNAPSATVR